jgi:light-regulated signal transduction histidine kinase (bacteriophytochrome)
MNSTPRTTEEQLAQLIEENEELKAELAKARLELESARAEAEKNRSAAELTGEEFQQFVYAASHDLQEPLRTVSSYSQLLQREYPNDKQAAEFTAFIVNAASQMTNLVRDLHAYSRTNAPPRRSMINLGIAVQRAQLKLADGIRQQGARLEIGSLPEVFADENQMSQVFEHLIANALRYRGPVAPVIEISAVEGPEFHTISVRDNGPGIDPRFQEQIFVPFKRLHPKNVSGSGLGLAVCRRLVRAHGGEIWVESDGISGSEFRLTLPV